MQPAFILSIFALEASPV